MTTAASQAPPLGDRDVESLDAAELISALAERFGGGLVLACSFQKEETVLLDMLLTADPSARVFALDTHVLFPETYAYWQQVEERYATKIEVFEGPSMGRQAAEHGPTCGRRRRIAAAPSARSSPWRVPSRVVTAGSPGVRRDQSPTRANAPKLEWDQARGMWKANPLADWDDERCWAYIREHGLPHNPLHDKGYASIGCTYCTMPGDGREGRWSGQGKTECGLHVP